LFLFLSTLLAACHAQCQGVDVAATAINSQEFTLFGAIEIEDSVEESETEMERRSRLW
jgi:hypothetical protein